MKVSAHLALAAVMPAHAMTRRWILASVSAALTAVLRQAAAAYRAFTRRDRLFLSFLDGVTFGASIARFASIRLNFAQNGDLGSSRSAAGASAASCSV